MTETRSQLEARRLSAIEDLKSNLSGGFLARKYHVTRTTISRWRKFIKAGNSMKSTQALGRPRRLEPAQIKLVYNKGPRPYGFFSDKWTGERFIYALQMEFGVRYDVDHATRLMHKHTDYRGVGKRKAVAANA